MQNTLIILLVLFIWLIAPAMIVHSKGRRWWVWFPVSLILPGSFLILAIFMHGVDKNGDILVS